MSGIYLHIPFCASRCVYCGFYSTTNAGLQSAYVDALCREMRLRSHEIASLGPVRSIYFGGGTPSQLSPSQLSQLFLGLQQVCFPDVGEALWSDVEITLEANPDDVTPEFAATMGSLPVNRVSLGVQTFNDERLRFIRRRHTARQAAEAVGRLRAAAIDNISIDLMFGFPQQTLQEWLSDIDSAILLDVDHISTYALTYEEGTVLDAWRQQQKVAPVDDELYRQMYEALIDRLQQAGFEHYEISNFGKKRSRHNSGYWQQMPYVGLGAAAHSYDRKSRSWNIAHLEQYIRAINNGERPCQQEQIDEQTAFNDLIVTALRTREGIDVGQLAEPYGSYLLTQSEPMRKRGLLQLTDNRLHLTRQGLFISDDIMTRLISIDHEKDDQPRV